jgi:hypothetical protein
MLLDNRLRCGDTRGLSLECPTIQAPTEYERRFHIPQMLLADELSSEAPFGMELGRNVMITVRRWFMVGMLLSLCAGCAEYEALPRDCQPQQQAQAQASAAVIAAR